jgi:hypothetical protein
MTRFASPSRIGRSLGVGAIPRRVGGLAPGGFAQARTTFGVNRALGVGVIPKRLFFDRELVIRSMDDASRKALSKGGGYVRKTARNSMRPSMAPRRQPDGRRYVRDADGKVVYDRQFVWRKVEGGLIRYPKPSEPGSPPHRHSNPLLHRLLFYAFDPGSRSVVVGPSALGKSRVPELMEFGGTTVSESPVFDPKQRRWRKSRRTVRIQPRPYMAPALAKAIAAGVVPGFYRNAMRRVA